MILTIFVRGLNIQQNIKKMVAKKLIITLIDNNGKQFDLKSTNKTLIVINIFIQVIINE